MYTAALALCTLLLTPLQIEKKLLGYTSSGTMAFTSMSKAHRRDDQQTMNCGKQKSSPDLSWSPGTLLEPLEDLTRREG